MSTEQKPTSTRKQVFHLVMFVFWICMAGYFAHHIYVILVERPAAIERIYQEGQAEQDALNRKYCSDPEQAAYDPETCDKYVGQT
jgi:hypothetical protein